MMKTSTEESLHFIRQSLKSEEMDHLEGIHFDRNYPHVFVTLGASGDLAKKKSIQRYGGCLGIIFYQKLPHSLVTHVQICP